MLRTTRAAPGRRGVLIPMPLPIMRLVVPVIAKAAPALIPQDLFQILLGGSATRDPRLAEGGGFARTPFGAASRRGLKAPPPAPARKTRPARHAGASRETIFLSGKTKAVGGCSAAKDFPPCVADGRKIERGPITYGYGAPDQPAAAPGTSHS
jgi:hypothetical protein